MLVHYCKIDRLKEDRVITVVLVNVFCHLYKLVNALYLPIDIVKQLTILRRWREQLDYLQNLDLEPRARSHVIIIVLCVFLDMREDHYELGNE